MWGVWEKGDTIWEFSFKSSFWLCWIIASNAKAMPVMPEIKVVVQFAERSLWGVLKHQHSENVQVASQDTQFWTIRWLGYLTNTLSIICLLRPSDNIFLRLCQCWYWGWPLRMSWCLQHRQNTNIQWIPPLRDGTGGLLSQTEK